jgi:hypothetical protein
VAGTYPASLLPEPFGELAAHVLKEEGDNDGFVSTRSAARWHAPITVAAHHLGLIGQPMRQGIGPLDRCQSLTPSPLARLLHDGLGPTAHAVPGA